MHAQPLPDDWTLKLDGAPHGIDVPRAVRDATVPATVPGCVHTDLLAAGLIDDPYLGLNEPDTHWIGACGWTYATHFNVDAALLVHDRVDLAFDGLDTACTVMLNGQPLGDAANMHVRHRFDAKPHLVAGANELEVRFTSPLAYARSVEERVGPRPHIGGGANAQLPHHMIRKMACNFGWDWGPQLVTCGIWRPARLEAWSTARIRDVRPLVTRATADLAIVRVHVDLETAGSSGNRIRCMLADPDGAEVADAAGPGDDTPLELRVERPRRWWPVGYGGQPLYQLNVELVADNGSVLDRKSHRIGLRTVELVIEADAAAGGLADSPEGLTRGESFALHVNGERVFCKGANWIPDDCFPHRVTANRYRRRIEQAAAVHMNMLRVWGGGIYEDRAFYDVCDQMGVLVWQDFCLACSCYAEEEPLWSQFEAEARDNVARLSPHPSLVLWNGCNENIWGTFDWSAFGDIRTAGELTWGLGYYLELFPEVLAELDDTRPYWPGSPYSGSMERHPNLNEYGNRHIWDVWNGMGDYQNYLGHYPRFASEFGFQGPPTWPTLARAVPPDERQWLSATSHQHNKQIAGQQRALDRIGDSFEVPGGFDDRWFLASVNQARALTLGCEWFRALSPWCSGALYWQLNDCWPVTSWAAIDGDGRPKLLWYATRRFFRPRLLTILPAAVTPAGTEPDGMAVYLHNDDADPWHDTVRVRRLDVSGRTLDTAEFAADVEPRGTRRFVLPAGWTGTAGDVLVAELADGDPDDRAWWFFGRDRDIDYPPANLRCTLDDGPGGSRRLTVTTDALVRELCLFADRLDPEVHVDRQLVNLLPGESVTFTLTGGRPLTLDPLRQPHVLRHVNPFGSGGVDVHTALAAAR